MKVQRNAREGVRRNNLNTITYIAMGDNCWGRGNTPNEAKRVARSVGARKKLSVYRLPVGAQQPWVDNFGTIRWEGPEGDCQQVE